LKPPAPEADPRVIYSDGALVVFDKPAGMPAQPTRTTDRGTAMEYVSGYLARRGARPDFLAPAHRLDAPTSGLLCLALTRQAASALQGQFSRHEPKRLYLAVVAGAVGFEEAALSHRLELDRGRSFARVVEGGRGREARTLLRRLEAKGDRSLLIASPETGLTHQIRVQLAAAGHPILGDSRYGRGGAARLALHAFALALRHPLSGKPLALEAPPGADFWALW
jgi:23S rRNA pseudouridine1911/1915/1917 synthase